MKRRFDLKYQLFINEQTGVATCKLIDIKLANWVNAGTCINYSKLVLAKCHVTARYYKNGWPVAHATPSPTAKRDNNFGMRLAKKRLIYKVMLDLVQEMTVITENLYKIYTQYALLNQMNKSLDRIQSSINDLYVKAGINEGEYMADVPKDQLWALSNIDRWKRIHPEPVDDKGSDNNG